MRITSIKEEQTIVNLLNIFILTLLQHKTVIAEDVNFPIITLENKILELKLTPETGGRISHFSLKGQRNFLNIGDVFKKNVLPVVSPFADNIGYLGHMVWVGPQSQWWLQQKLNEDRLANKANWPPDPFTVLATNTIKKQSKKQVLLHGVKSPITGLRLDKAVSLSRENTNQVNLKATATNISAQNKAWNLWFNTRVHGNTYIITTVSSRKDVKIISFANENVSPITINYINYKPNNFFVELDVRNFIRTNKSNQGKVLIHPNQGWLAGFNQGQLFIIAFPLQDKSKIHPEHGQIEVYTNYHPKNIENSLIEMEFHGSFQTLKPKEKMSVDATWYLFPYPVGWDKKRKLNFLQKQLLALGLF